MRRKKLIGYAGVGCAASFICEGAWAAYTGLQVTTVLTSVPLDPVNPTNLTPVYLHRVWARFSNPNDALYAWGGGGALGSALVHNVTTGLGQIFPGSGFLNSMAGGDLPPTSNAAISDSDTYFTIGVTLQTQIPAGQGILLSTIPGTPSGLAGNSINLSNGGGVETNPTTSSGAPNPITLAGFTGDGDTVLRVLLMQLLTNPNEEVGGSIGITFNLGGLAGATTTLQNQTFGFIPVPAPLALLGAAGLFLRRRRRA